VNATLGQDHDNGIRCSDTCLKYSFYKAVARSDFPVVEPGVDTACSKLLRKANDEAFMILTGVTDKRLWGTFSQPPLNSCLYDAKPTSMAPMNETVTELCSLP
jgi:hypothetical protein